MLSLATIHFFPSYSLDTSILIAVLIGVVVLALLTETLGWVFVGLVVPGYLASVFVLHPETGATIVLEALFTYLLAMLLSEVLPKTGAWSSFFGRDRFFVILVASVLVREVFELCLLPRLGMYVDATYGTSFTLDRTLHSIGLVLVPLTANGFWKLGMRRGLFQVGVPVAITYAILRFVLLPSTNLSFSSLELMYEDIARSFLASPKAYILLLVTAVLAARFNLRYGWDFNGILVPALLALIWIAPLKLLATCAEVMMLVVGTRAILSLPGIRTLNLEGPRKTVFVFVLGFALKWALGWSLGGRVPGLKVTDLFGFGYLVPTLLAVKILQKQVVFRIGLAALQTSLAGFIVGSLIGFDLSGLEPKPAYAGDIAAIHAKPSALLERTPLGVMALARAATRESEAGAPLPTRRDELREYATLWRSLDKLLEAPTPEHRAAADDLASRLGLQLRNVQSTNGRALLVMTETRPLEDRVGWDTALLAPGSKGPVLLVPRPVSEAPSAEAASILCERVQCSAVIVSGMDTRLSGSKLGDAWVEQQTPLEVAQEVLGARTRLMIVADGNVAEGAAVLHSANAAVLSSVWPGVKALTVPPEDPGCAWKYGVSILRANPIDLMSVVTDAAPPLAGSVAETDLLDTLGGPAAQLAAGRRVSPTDEELLVLQRQIAAPLLGASVGLNELRWVSAMANLFDLRVRTVDGCAANGGSCVLISDADASKQQLGATLLLRTSGKPLAVEVPTADRERGTLPFALELFHLASARAVLIASGQQMLGDDAPHAASSGQMRTPFQAFHQALHGHLPSEDGLVVQLRGFSATPQLAHETLIISTSRPVLDQRDHLAQLDALLNSTGPLGELVSGARYHDGSAALSPLVDPSAQRLYSRSFQGPPLVTFWLSEQLRGRYVPMEHADAMLLSLGVSPQKASPRERLALPLPNPGGAAAQVDPALKKTLRDYQQIVDRLLTEQSPHDLRALLSPRTSGDISSTAEVGLSTEFGMPYVVLSVRRHRQELRALFFLKNRADGQPPAELSIGGPAFEQELDKALEQRRSVVVTGELLREARR